MVDPLSYPPPWLRRLLQGAEVSSFSPPSPSREPGGGGEEGRGGEVVPEMVEPPAFQISVLDLCPRCQGALPPPVDPSRSGFERFCAGCRPLVFPGPDPLNADCTFTNHPA
jgi:hypothetical protein